MGEGSRRQSLRNPRRDHREQKSYERAKAALGDIARFDEIQWAICDDIDKDPDGWPYLGNGYYAAYTEAGMFGLRGRLIFWYSFDGSTIYLWDVFLVAEE